jgi:hypothetical protein
MGVVAIVELAANIVAPGGDWTFPRGSLNERRAEVLLTVVHRAMEPGKSPVVVDSRGSPMQGI